jgi:UDP-4-amino-4,6-dideoxy-N-acetyl-beta-L-altrosamine N-acetyltransferase
MEFFSNFLLFISSLKNEPLRGFWWVKDYKGRDIGSINLNLFPNGKEASLSLFKMPTYPKGGSILMETLLFVAFELLELQKVTLVVFKDNERAYYLYKKYLFEEVGTFNYKGRKVLKMELTREKYI